MRTGGCITAASAACLALGMSAPSVSAQPAAADEIGELRRAVETLRAENRALAERLQVLEAQRPKAPTSANAAPPSTDSRQAERLVQRLDDLESNRIAQESAVRSIIRDAISTRGSKINEAAALGGTLSVELGQQTDFEGRRKRLYGLAAADFELELALNDWSTGHIKLEYIQDTSQGPATASSGAVDRLSVDTAYISLGNVQRFPAVLSLGRMVLPFGTSTGHPVTDVLSLGSPLTVEAFELRQDAVSLTWSWPTPTLAPPLPPVFAPPVVGRWVSPLVARLGQRLGYASPPAPVKPLSPVQFNPVPPPLHAGVYFFGGTTPGPQLSRWGAMAGFRAKGHCGQTYEQLRDSQGCPWALSIDLAYNSAIFNSRFLQAERADVFDKVGNVPGLSLSSKATLGPYALVGEWNGATRTASLRSATGQALSLRPMAWQVSLGYQLGWHPWVQEIGAQGSYLALGYSRTSSLQSLSTLVAGVPVQMAGLPRQRLLLTAGEWVQDGLRLVLEYSREWDYSISDGGTGLRSHGWTTSLTYAW